MGIRGLYTYIQEYADAALEWHKLQNCKLVIDGNNLAHEIYSNSPGINVAFGGDYDKYAVHIEKFFSKLFECNVEPIVIMDGGYPLQRSKFSTVYSRLTDQLESAMSIHPDNQDGMKIFPIMGRSVFVNVAQKLGVTVLQSDFEADDEIAVIAKKLNAYVLSNDSDFYLFDIPFILLHSVNMKHIQKETKEGKDSKFIPCYRFDADTFSKITGVRKELIPVLAPILGNDFLNPKMMISFYAHLAPLRPAAKGISHRQRIIISAVKWLAKQKDGSADEVLKRVIGTKNMGFSRRLKMTLKEILDMYSPEGGYLKSWICSHKKRCPVMKEQVNSSTDTPVTLGNFKPGWFASSSVSKELSCTCETRTRNGFVTIGQMPDWFVRAFRLHLIPHTISDILTKDYLFTAPMIEILECKSLYLRLEVLIKKIRGILWGTCAHGLSLKMRGIDNRPKDGNGFFMKNLKDSKRVYSNKMNGTSNTKDENEKISWQTESLAVEGGNEYPSQVIKKFSKKEKFIDLLVDNDNNRTQIEHTDKKNSKETDLSDNNNRNLCDIQPGPKGGNLEDDGFEGDCHEDDATEEGRDEYYTAERDSHEDDTTEGDRYEDDITEKAYHEDNSTEKRRHEDDATEGDPHEDDTAEEDPRDGDTTEGDPHEDDTPEGGPHEDDIAEDHYENDDATDGDLHEDNTIEGTLHKDESKLNYELMFCEDKIASLKMDYFNVSPNNNISKQKDELEYLKETTTNGFYDSCDNEDDDHNDFSNNTNSDDDDNDDDDVSNESSDDYCNETENEEVNNITKIRYIPPLRLFIRDRETLTAKTLPQENVSSYKKFPSLFKIDKWTELERKNLFYKTVGLEINLKEGEALSSNIEFILLCIIYWKSNFDKHIALDTVFAVLMCVVMFNIVDGKLGRVRSKGSPNEALHYLNKIKTKKESGCLPDPSTLTIEGLIQSLTVEECRLASLSLNQLHKMDSNVNRRSYDRYVVHAFSEYQASINYLQYLNSLLYFPFPVISMDAIWSGTFCYNVYNCFAPKKQVGIVLSTIFEGNNRVSYLFLKLYGVLQGALSLPTFDFAQLDLSINNKIRNKILFKKKKLSAKKTRVKMKKLLEEEIQEYDKLESPSEEDLLMMAENKFSALLIM